MCAVKRSVNIMIENEIVSFAPAPKDKGVRKIMRLIEAPDRWYTDRTHARKTSSSVIGACNV